MKFRNRGPKTPKIRPGTPKNLFGGHLEAILEARDAILEAKNAILEAKIEASGNLHVDVETTTAECAEPLGRAKSTASTAGACHRLTRRGILSGCGGFNWLRHSIDPVV